MSTLHLYCVSTVSVGLSNVVVDAVLYTYDYILMHQWNISMLGGGKKWEIIRQTFYRPLPWLHDMGDIMILIRVGRLELASRERPFIWRMPQVLKVYGSIK